MKFSSTAYANVQQAPLTLTTISKSNNPILQPLFFKEHLNPQVRNNKMVNKYSANYHSFSIDSLGLFLSLEVLLNFLSKLYVPSWFRKIFKFLVFSTVKCTCQSKIESRHFYSGPGFLSSSPGIGKFLILIAPR